MALIPCKECGKEISDKAVTCPNCGMPPQLNSNQYIEDSFSREYLVATPLISCRVCKTEVLQKAFICPNCGIRNPDTHANLKATIFLSLIIFTFLLIVNYDIWFRWGPFFNFFGSACILLNMCGWLWYFYQDALDKDP